MQNGTRIVALSALTALLVSSLVVVAGSQIRRDYPEQLPVTIDTNLETLEAERMREQSVVTDVIRRAEPAVVSVIISKDLPVLERTFEEVPFGNSPFRIRIPRTRERGTERREVGGGTAFFVSGDGLLMTNKHVVSDEEARYTVLLNDGRTLEADILARDAVNDIALLKVKGTGFPFLDLASQDEPTLGQSVIAIGNALAEFRNTVSVGVISGLQRTITAGNPAAGTVETLSHIIQTDAAINQGNSGGPLLTLRGEVIGMNTAVAAGAQNISFAIPVDELQRVLRSYNRFGRIVRPYIGVRYILVTPALAKEKKLAASDGVLVISGEGESELGIVPGSPAEKAGIKEGDVILEADGQKLTEETMLSGIVQSKAPGETIRLKIVRDGKEQTVTVTLEEWKE